MKCMCAQTRPRFIFSSERVLGGMEFEPMLTPREKSPLPENVPRVGSNPRRRGQRAQALPTELFWPPCVFHDNRGMAIYMDPYSDPDFQGSPDAQTFAHTWPKADSHQTNPAWLTATTMFPIPPHTFSQPPSPLRKLYDPPGESS